MHLVGNILGEGRGWLPRVVLAPVPCDFGFGGYGQGLRVKGLGFRGKGFGVRVSGLGFRGEGSGLRVGFRVWGLGLGFRDLGVGAVL